ncbi:MAG: glycoside hydrolase family 3 N-terminal domain-containing protein [Cyclobacteriaceae bacterium]
MKTYMIMLVASSFLLACGSKWKEIPGDSFNTIENEGGKTLAYSPASGVKILTIDGLAFKDLNKNGSLDAYEDWRLTADERAANLASQLTLEQIAGLMLYSSHQSIPARSGGYFAGTYDGKPYEEGVTDPSNLTDQQKKFITEDHLRHVLITTVKSPEVAAQWNNKLQALCEGLGAGIPANNSSDPRHGTNARAEYNAAAGGAISMWPSSLGMAATFDPALVEEFGKIASTEYRALGITTALSPQIDIATEPRWARFSGTFGESPLLSAAMGRAYCDGFQSNEWGANSVNTMVKHWPGGGSGEAGRDAHYANGKFAVYPGDNFKEHLIPFTEGAFKLNGNTKKASAVMPYYTVSWNQTSENVANNYNKEIITDLLREKYGYDGVVCTDWLVTADHRAMDLFVDGKPWGIEQLNVVERHYKALMAGVDQYGGNNDMKPILAAYDMGVKEHGEEWMRARMEESAVRLLRNIFNTGLFENPYLNREKTKGTVGKPEFMKAGYEAQLKSIVMLKNHENALPAAEQMTVFVPKRYIAASRNFLGVETPASEEYPVNMDIVKKYFKVTDNPDEADFAIVYIENPKSGIGYDKEDVAKGGNGYLPISLQYSEYMAFGARAVSIAGGDPMESFLNRTYKGKKVTTLNATDAQMVVNTRKKMKNKPVVVLINASNPMVFSEIEPHATSILMGFEVQDQAFIELIAGKAEPSALLPAQMPADMATVEKQLEDVPFDMTCHQDADGNVYDFGFGMNWSGVIKDGRAGQFRK